MDHPVRKKRNILFFWILTLKINEILLRENREILIYFAMTANNQAPRKGKIFLIKNKKIQGKLDTISWSVCFWIRQYPYNSHIFREMIFTSS